MNKLFPVLLFCGLFFFACQQEGDLGYVEYEPKIVVEGWIENGTPATVMLSWSVSFNQDPDTASLLQHVIRSAKVSVSDGVQTEILTLGIDKDYIPPYTYYGNTLIGESGKIYTLTVEYRNSLISAETYIPEPIPLRDYRFVKAHPADTFGYVHIAFENTLSDDACYQVATKTGKEKVYTPCLSGNMRPDMFEKGEKVDIQINKGPVLFPKLNLDTYFLEGDVISLKFRTQPQHGYNFWTSWQNEVLNTQNPIFPANTSLSSNIEEGIGIWCGYGTYTYTIDTGKKNTD